MFQKLVLYSAAALIVVHAVVIPTPDSNAAGSCNDWSLVPNEANLAAACRNAAGTVVGTNIAIGQCVGNNNGNLGCQAGGGAGASCVFFNIVQGSGVLEISAHCTTRSGGSNTVTNFNINDCLTNQNGQLTC
ncbi:hypothetical protein C8R44DRAFT_885266 [Mycena epipterygia]|nr:hypothetical protein C8R44DRAFT_885266 [Mycena epipterygia]